MTRRLCLGVVGMVVICGSLAYSGEVTTKRDDVDITLGGQLRIRTEINDKSTALRTTANEFTEARTRLHAKVSVGDSVKGLVQIQDVRVWGTTAQLAKGSAGTFDIHQGYVKLMNVFGSALSLKLGRQEIILDGHRLVGSVNWTQQARTFDGVKLHSKGEGWGAQFFATKITERNGTGTGQASSNRDRNFYGLHGNMGFGPGTGISVLALFDEDDSNAATVATNTVSSAGLKRLTSGVRGTLASGGFKARGEFYLQTGDASTSTVVSAYMYGFRAGYTAKEAMWKPNVTLWYDYLSGDSNTGDGKSEVFNTLFATNHKFYGYMDFFLNIPANTGGRGLQDLALKTSAQPADWIKVKADFHAFLLAEKSSVATGNDKGLGQELDLTTVFNLKDRSTKVVVGYSHLFNTNMARVGRGTEDADWAYVQVDFNF